MFIPNFLSIIAWDVESALYYMVDHSLAGPVHAKKACCTYLLQACILGAGIAVVVAIVYNLPPGTLDMITDAARNWTRAVILWNSNNNLFRKSQVFISPSPHLIQNIPVSLGRLMSIGCWMSENVYTYCEISNISCTLVGNKIVHHSDVVGASPVSTAPTTS